MTYSKEVTAVILADWAKGFTAEETKKHLLKLYGKTPHLNSIYAHRHSLTASHLADELVRQQQRDIALTESNNLRMKYRDLLLDKLLLKTNTENKVLVNVNNSNSANTLLQDAKVFVVGQEEVNVDELSEETRQQIVMQARQFDKLLQSHSNPNKQNTELKTTSSKT
jgi:hypothetical protein